MRITLCSIFSHKWEIKENPFHGDFRGSSFSKFLANRPNKKRVCVRCHKTEFFSDRPKVKTKDEIRSDKIDKLLK